ncbi:unnamed protein product [Haemonchus placei]|uniref:Uncharacterized protein n=1 Tax=Haemonchus placei TaxID=6290 RepID=A0A3P7XT14_HAEPC|nr:unnamed protein product [Haemonchus placei]
MDAHELNPTSIAILKILCSTTGRLAEESGVRDKINLGFEFKVSSSLELHLFRFFYGSTCCNGPISGHSTSPEPNNIGTNLTKNSLQFFILLVNLFPSF